MDLLALAFYLSVLTYYLGVLIRALPIPLYGLKRWAPRLMVDGVFSAILVFSYNTILWVIRYFGAVLGADWTQYYKWLDGMVAGTISLLAILQVIGSSLTSAGLSFLAHATVSPLISSLTYLLVFIMTVSILVSVVVAYSQTLIALGLVLHAIPFRLARASGATLIAFVIVFSVGVPLMPVFIETITSDVSRAYNTVGYGYYLAEITVKDSLNTGIPFYLYEVYSLNQTLLARYMADGSGVVNASSLEKGIPTAKHVVTVKYGGYEYTLVLDPQASSERAGAYIRLNLTLPNMVVLRTLRYVALFNTEYFEVLYKTSTEVSLMASSGPTGYFIVVSLLSDTVNVYVNGASATPVKTYQYSWGGVSLVARNYTLSSGLNSVYVYIGGDAQPQPRFDEVYYARDYLRVSATQTLPLVQQVAVLVFKLLVAPIIYLSILFTSTLALSRLLGGSTSRIVRVLVSGV